MHLRCMGSEPVKFSINKKPDQAATRITNEHIGFADGTKRDDKTHSGDLDIKTLYRHASRSLGFDGSLILRHVESCSSVSTEEVQSSISITYHLLA